MPTFELPPKIPGGPNESFVNVRSMVIVGANGTGEPPSTCPATPTACPTAAPDLPAAPTGHGVGCRETGPEEGEEVTDPVH